MTNTCQNNSQRELAVNELSGKPGAHQRYHRILAEELHYARTWTSEHQRANAIEIWNIHYNYHRPHTTAGNQPPATRLPAIVTNVMTSNT